MMMMMMCNQEVQSNAFVAETSNVYYAMVAEVGVEGGYRETTEEDGDQNTC